MARAHEAIRGVPEFSLLQSQLVLPVDGCLAGAFGKDESEGRWAWTLFRDRLVVYEQNSEGTDTIPTPAVEWVFSAMGQGRGLAAVELAYSGHPLLLVAVEGGLQNADDTVLYLYAPFYRTVVPIGILPCTVACLATLEPLCPQQTEIVTQALLMAHGELSGRQVELANQVGEKMLVATGTTGAAGRGPVLLVGVVVDATVKALLQAQMADDRSQSQFPTPGGCNFVDHPTGHAVDLESSRASRGESRCWYRGLVGTDGAVLGSSRSGADRRRDHRTVASVAMSLASDQILIVAAAAKADGDTDQLRYYRVPLVPGQAATCETSSPNTAAHYPMRHLVVVGQTARVYGVNSTDDRLCAYPFKPPGGDPLPDVVNLTGVCVVRHANGSDGGRSRSSQDIVAVSTDTVQLETSVSEQAQPCWVVARTDGTTCTYTHVSVAAIYEDYELGDETLLDVWMGGDQMLCLFQRGLVAGERFTDDAQEQGTSARAENASHFEEPALRPAGVELAAREEEYEHARARLQQLCDALDNDPTNPLAFEGPQILTEATHTLQTLWPEIVAAHTQAQLAKLQQWLSSGGSDLFPTSNIIPPGRRACLSGMVSMQYGPAASNEDENTNALRALQLQLPDPQVPTLPDTNDVKGNDLSSTIAAIKAILKSFVHKVRHAAQARAVLHCSIVHYLALDLPSQSMQAALTACDLPPNTATLVQAYHWLDNAATKAQPDNPKCFVDLLAASANVGSTRLLSGSVVVAQLQASAEQALRAYELTRTPAARQNLMFAGNRIIQFVHHTNPPLDTQSARYNYVFGLAAGNKAMSAVHAIRDWARADTIDVDEAKTLFALVLKMCELKDVLGLALGPMGQPGDLPEESWLRVHLLRQHKAHVLALYYLQRGRLREAQLALEEISRGGAPWQHTETQLRQDIASVQALVDRAARLRPSLAASCSYWPGTDPDMQQQASSDFRSDAEADAVASLHRSLLGYSSPQDDEVLQQDDMDTGAAPSVNPQQSPAPMPAPMSLDGPKSSPAPVPGSTPRPMQPPSARRGTIAAKHTPLTRMGTPAADVPLKHTPVAQVVSLPKVTFGSGLSTRTTGTPVPPVAPTPPPATPAPQPLALEAASEAPVPTTMKKRRTRQPATPAPTESARRYALRPRRTPGPQ